MQYAWDQSCVCIVTYTLYSYDVFKRRLHGKEIKLSYDLYLRILFILKVLTYVVLVCWFWRVPVASISRQLVQPFGKMISWRAGGVVKIFVMVGIIPWLILSTRVSKFVCRLAKF
ncbi:hypothetical protein PS2_017882 [Malus domestica]